MGLDDGRLTWYPPRHTGRSKLVALVEEAGFADEVATVREARSLEAGADRISDAFRDRLVVSGPPKHAASS